MAAAAKLTEWNNRMDAVSLDKADMNKLVMNFLVIEGYKDAAEKFAEESGMATGCDASEIDSRMRIRAAVQRGDIDAAVDLVNDLNPEILDTNPALYFHLQQQRLIELIRDDKVDEALEFAQEHLARRGEENPTFLADLERTMALLAFDRDSVEKSPVGYLLDASQRQKTASELNSAILEAQCQEQSPKLPRLLSLLAWAQSALDEKNLTFPHMHDLVTTELKVETSADKNK